MSRPEEHSSVFPIDFPLPTQVFADVTTLALLRALAFVVRMADISPLLVEAIRRGADTIRWVPFPVSRNKEAHTLPSVKDLLVAVAGVDGLLWETPRTVLEVGPPAPTVFKLLRSKRGTRFQERRAEVVQRLSAYYSKLWFPEKKDAIHEDR